MVSGNRTIADGQSILPLTDGYSTVAEVSVSEVLVVPIPDGRLDGSGEVSSQTVFYRHPAAESLGLTAYLLIAIEERGPATSGDLEDLLRWANRGSSDPVPRGVEELFAVAVCGEEVYVVSAGASSTLVVLHYRDSSMLELRFSVVGLPSVADFVAEVLADLVWRDRPAFACSAGEIRTALRASGLRTEPEVNDTTALEARAEVFGDVIPPLDEVNIDLDVSGSFLVAYGDAPEDPFDWYEWFGDLRVSAIEPPVEFTAEQLSDLEERLHAVSFYGRLLGREDIPPGVYDLVALTNGTSVRQSGSELEINIDSGGGTSPAMAEGLRSQLAAWLVDAGVSFAIVADPDLDE